MNQKFCREAWNLTLPKICHGITQIERPGQNKLLGLKRGGGLKQAPDKRFNPKFTSTKEATSLLRIPQREGYHEEPLASRNPTKEDWCSPRKLHKGERMYKLSGAPHEEGTQRATPNRLEASFKSNKCKSTNLRPHQVLLEMNSG
jgi:hypothetical protein